MRIDEDRTRAEVRAMGDGEARARRTDVSDEVRPREFGAEPRDEAIPGEIVTDRSPLPWWCAVRSLVRCVFRTGILLFQRAISQPTERLGQLLRFGDGSGGRIYRETVVDGAAVGEPVVLVVAFRLRWVRGFGHTLFRAESLLNTPLFVGFPGFVSKLWLAHDENGRYRGVYQWNGAQLADVMPEPCGGCLRWSACVARSTMWCYRAIDEMTCWRTLRYSTASR